MRQFIAPHPTMFQSLLDQALFTTYRVAAYALLSLADDAAILALMFC